MRINLFLIPFVIVLGLLFTINDNKKSRLLYIIICSTILVLVAALRSPDWLTDHYHIDTLVYKHYFESAIDMSFNEILQELHLRYVLNMGDFDVGFIVLCKTIGLFTKEFWLYSIIADLLFFVPLGLILYRYTTNCKQIIFAFVFYLALIQPYLLGGARQIFSLGFDLMALIAMLNNRKKRSIILFIIGVTIHMSSVLFALPLIMLAFKMRAGILKALHAACFMAFPLVLLFPNEIISYMGDALGMEKYSNYGKGVVQGGATTYIILIELLSLFCLIAIKVKDMISNNDIWKFYVMAPLFTFFAPLIHSNGSMDRITLYYYLFIVLLVPYGIECMFKQSYRGFVYAVTIGSLAFLSMMNGGVIYYFFWQL